MTFWNLILSISNISISIQEMPDFPISLQRQKVLTHERASKEGKDEDFECGYFENWKWRVFQKLGLGYVRWGEVRLG